MYKYLLKRVLLRIDFLNSFTTKIASFKVRRSLVIYLIISIFFWRVVLELHAQLASVI